MKQRRALGRTGIEISPIGLGCWQFSQGQGMIGNYWESISNEHANEIVKVSLEANINWFDTAEAYGNGRSEEVLAAALRAAGVEPGGAVIATKWWPFLRTAGNLKSTIGVRLQKLGGYPIDLLQVHQPLSLSSVQAQMNAMADLVSDERIRSVGVSNFSASRMRDAHAFLKARGIALASNQMPYSLLDRRIESKGVLGAARELGVTIIAYSPLAQGLLTGRFHEHPEDIQSRPGPRKWMPRFRHKSLVRTWPLIKVLRQVAEQHQATVSQVALNWLVTHHGDTVVAIPGATRVQQAVDNAGAMTFELTRQEQDRIDEASRRLM